MKTYFKSTVANRYILFPAVPTGSYKVITYKLSKH